MTTKTTILAIHPFDRRFGYAVFEGTALVDWGIKDLRPSTPSEAVIDCALRQVRSLVDRYDPDVIVLPTTTRVSSSVRSNLVRAVKQSRMAATVTFSRRQIRKTFSAGGQASVSKHSIILKLIRWFPTLERSQPFRRRIWDAEDYWTPMFDALSLAVTFLANHE